MKSGIRQEFELTTRDRYTKVDCEIGIKIDGKELPSLEILGGALEKAIDLVQAHVSEAYAKVPERTGA